MLKPSDVKRIFATVNYLFRGGGIRGIVFAVHQRLRLERQLFPFRKIKSINLNGCTFDVARLPNLPIKLALLNKTYEELERSAVLRYIRPEIPAIELGGCIGVVSCITNKLLNNPKEHVVVEANPRVLSHLNENRTTNRCEFEVLNAAIAYGKNFVVFTPSTDFWDSSLDRNNGSDPVTVETVRLGDIVSKKQFKTFTLICDIEGHECELVRNEADILGKADTIILETHARMIGEPKTFEMLNRLERLSFKTVAQNSSIYVLKRSF